MLVLLAMAAAWSGTGDHALAWASRLEMADLRLTRRSEDSLNAYRQVVRRYPGCVGAWLGQGRRLVVFGAYREAAACFRKAGNRAAERDAASRAEAVSNIGAQVKPRSVVQIEPIPGLENRWVALLATRKPGNGRTGVEWEGTKFGRPQVAVLRLSAGRYEQVARTDVADSGEPADIDDLTLVVANLEHGKDPAAIAHIGYLGADNYTNTQTVHRIRNDRLVKVQEFYGKDDAAFLPADARRGLRVVTQATWKIWWPDVYEWRRGRFRFANRRNAEVFGLLGRVERRPVGEDRKDYFAWSRYAAWLGVRGRFAEAAKAWRSAASACRRSLRAHINPDPGWYGDTRENYRNMMRRLRWLAKGDFDHPLLYRPYDFDLQVPPYRLGKASRARQ